MIMKKVTVMFKSRSQPGVEYKAERHRNGNVSCFCPGFVYNQKCWHVERLQQYKVTSSQK